MGEADFMRMVAAMVVWGLVSGSPGAKAAAGGGALEELRCEGRLSPLAVAESRPIFTWKYSASASREAVQSAAHVVVTSRLKRKLVWDSGWKDTRELALRYGGPSLQAGTRYRWHVETRNADGSLARSGEADFRTADAVWAARWIAAAWSTEKDGAEADGSKPMPVFRREFNVRGTPVEAILRIVGLGQWQATLQQRGVSNPVQPAGLHGAWTNYRKTVAYDTLDVTPLLRTGKATLTVLLGNGMYNVQRTPLPEVPRGARFTKFAGSFGVPKMLAELHMRYADGREEVIATDASWQVARGPVLFDSTYGGEDYDARLEPGAIRESRWDAVQEVPGPGGVLTPAIALPVGQHEIYRPERRTDIGGGRTVFDLGQNFAGVVRVNVHGPAGAVLRLTPGELLNKDGSVSQATFHGPMWWSYTLRGTGGGESWEPAFGYMGFRYVQAEWTPGPGTAASKQIPLPPAGVLDSVTGVAQYSDSPVSGEFASSSDLLNRIHALIVHAMHNNEVSLMTDCPHREKLGWLEETHLVAPGLMFSNDVQLLYRATDRNMADAQLADGIVPTIAPQYTHFGPKAPVFDDSPEWGSASVLAPLWAYRFYGDRPELERTYPMMEAYVAALAAKAVDGVVTYGLGDWYDIGPGGPGLEKNTSLGVTATMMLLEDAQAMQQIATVLGRPAEALKYAALASTTREAFNRKFWREDKGWYDTGSQTAQAMPLALGAVPPQRRPKVLSHLIVDIHAHQDHVTAGEIGYPYLLRALAQSGNDDVVLAMLMRKDPPSYGSQLEAGATALTEAWDANPHSSQDHFMLGSAESWFYQRLGGIDFDLSREKAEQRITLQPVALPGVDWVMTAYESRVGRIGSEWKRDGTIVTYTFTVPGGNEATIVIPENANAPAGVKRIASEIPGMDAYVAGPGRWVFRAGSR